MKPSVSHSGVLPYRLGAEGMELLIITTLGLRRWTVPRGHVGRRSSPRDTALREAYEEAGLVGEVHDGPIGTFCDWNGRGSGRSILLFPLRVVGEALTFPEMGRRDKLWIAPWAVDDFLREELAALVKGFNRRLGFGESASL